MPPTFGFSCVAIFRKDFTFTKEVCDVLYKMRYILWVVVLLGAFDVIHDGHHLGRHLGFYPKLDIIKKRWQLKVFDVDMQNMT